MNEASWTDKPNPEFEQWWATRTKAGYRYGREALENVRFGFEGAQERVRQLEQLNSLLAEQIDRQRPVIEAARAWWLSGYIQPAAITLAEEIGQYARRMAQLNKGA